MRGELNGSLGQAETEFLKSIEYFGQVNNKTRLENRIALLELTAQLLSFFQLPSPKSPNLFFFGSQLDTTVFDLSVPVDLNLGVAGRGFTAEAAFESCVGEASEFLSFHERLEDPHLVGDLDGCSLNEQHFRWCFSELCVDDEVDPHTLAIVMVERETDKKKFVMPAEYILRRPQNKRIGSKKTTTNGISAGPSIAAAKYSALMELVERDAIACWWFGGDPARRISESQAAELGLSHLVQHHRSAEASKVWFLDISSDTRIPVFACLSANENGDEISHGFGADFDWRTAAEKSFLEMCQVEIAQQLSLDRVSRLSLRELNEVDRRWLNKHQSLNLTDYPELSGLIDSNREYESSVSAGLNEAVLRLDDEGFEVFFARLTRPEIGIHVYRAIVPGLLRATPEHNSPRLLETMFRNKREHSTLDTRVPII